MAKTTATRRKHASKKKKPVRKIAKRARPRLAQVKSDAKAAGWKKWIRSDLDERAVHQGCYFSEQHGLHVVEFCRRFLRHAKGRWAGKPFELMDWQRDKVVMPLFGWRREDGRRRFKSADIWVPKKNGKSSLAAGIGLYGLVADGEEGAEIYAAACDRDQAGIVYGTAADMVAASPSLKSRLVTRRSAKTIRLGTSAWFRALSAEYTTHEGINAHYVIVDEIHAFDERGRSLFRTLYHSGAARLQPLRIVISTAGDDQDSIGYEQYEIAKSLIDGTSKDITSFAYIAEAGPEDNWSHRRTWKKANPSIGEIIRVEEMTEEYEKAKRSPRLKADFERYRLNRWVNTANPWLSAEAWDACGGNLDINDFEGRDCWGGLDLAAKMDLTAFVLCFPDEDDSECVSFFCWFFLPEDRIREGDTIGYSQWVKDGHITATPGNVTDYGFVEETIKECAARFRLREVAYDPWNATDIAVRLQDEGLQMVQFRQGYHSMNEPSKEFERRVLSGKVRHGDNPVLKWMSRNVTVKEDPAGNIKPVKPERRTNKIDGIVAAIMALGRATAGGGIEEPPEPMVMLI
ncbi:MAG: terminase large subunit [Methyloligellaceae bacterium]